MEPSDIAVAESLSPVSGDLRERTRRVAAIRETLEEVGVPLCLEGEATPDIKGLISMFRFVTPNLSFIKKRFDNQIYLYFLGGAEPPHLSLSEK